MHQSRGQELEVALTAVRAAAKVCQSVQAAITPEVLEKKDRSPVTVADYASQAVVCRALGQAFPDDPIIGEEDAAQLRRSENAAFLDRVRRELEQIGIQETASEICGWIDHGAAAEFSQRFWTLDPIDGTKGFLRGEQYAISLALIVEGEIGVAVLGCPNLAGSTSRAGQEADSARPTNRRSGGRSRLVTPACHGEAVGTLFYAVRDQGAFQMPLEGDSSAVPIRVTQTADSSQARFCESVESGHTSHSSAAQLADRLGITREPLRLDSQAKYAIIGRGDADIYLRLPTRDDYHEKIWDHAGGVLVVEEAGGTVTDVEGKPLEFTHGRKLMANRGAIVTNGILHGRVLEALASNSMS